MRECPPFGVYGTTAEKKAGRMGMRKNTSARQAVRVIEEELRMWTKGPASCRLKETDTSIQTTQRYVIDELNLAWMLKKLAKLTRHSCHLGSGIAIQSMECSGPERTHPDGVIHITPLVDSAAHIHLRQPTWDEQPGIRLL